ncbi:MAG: hypothetical protein GY723_13940 [bacterium]|nr:hypothetical protein [bacterium]
MTGQEAEAWLAGLINVERLPDRRRARFSLQPVKRLLGELGNPEDGLRILHIAGSKGKGSTALYAEALLRGAGLSVGTFTSPHLESWVERFRIDGAPVDGVKLGAAVARLRPIVEKLRLEPDAPSFFDATTAAALLLFAEARVDVAILEVGLGGRLDSTNVVEPAVSCITSIELEHTEILGTTLAAIAGEKAGIAKPGVPLVMGRLHEEAEAVVRSRCEKVGAPWVALGGEIEIEVEEEAGPCVAVRVRDGELQVRARLGAPGAHQASNAAIALACVLRLGVVPVERLAALAPQVLEALRLPARIEILGERPWVVVDAAHTAASAQALGAALARLPHRQGRFVLSVSTGKDLPAIAQAVLPFADLCLATRAEPVRSMPAEALAAALRTLAPQIEVRAVDDPRDALELARAETAPDDLLCATGSIYLAGIARAVYAGNAS